MKKRQNITKRGKQFLVLSLAILALASESRAQSVYLPTSNEIYPFLKRMEARELLEGYRDAAKPFSRIELAQKLQALDSVKSRMTSVERETYEFFKEEFKYELLKLAGDPEPSEIRWHVLSKELEQGIMNIDVNYRLGQTILDGVKTNIRSQGVKLYGYVYDDVGFYFNIVDNRETGKAINFGKTNTPQPGIVPSRTAADVLEYDDIDAQLTWRIGRFDFSVEKMKNSWGLARHGNIIFSDKAPSYPQLKMRVPLANWVDFVYIHADLNSRILDSTRSYFAGSSSISKFYRPVDRPKYMAAHQLEFTISRGIDLSIGESVVYSDRGPLLIYMIPVMFFKAGEHYNRDTDNSQIFGNLDLNVIPNLNLYFSLFIDEITTDDILDPTKARNQVAFTFGFQTYDLLFDNLELLAEYSRMNPWVYSHKYTAANFTNNGYDLGHWVGQNGDDLLLDLSLTPTRPLKFGTFLEVYRKGGRKDVAYQYMLPSQDFLYGPTHEERSFGLYGHYQFVRDGFFDVRARRLTVNDEAFPNLNLEKKWEFSVSASVGVW
ncbi:MAG: capsule assembly Wzi family protein [Bacteroidota bacterium]